MGVPTLRLGSLCPSPAQQSAAARVPPSLRFLCVLNGGKITGHSQQGGGGERCARPEPPLVSRPN